jgi:hypothetical protein
MHSPVTTTKEQPKSGRNDQRRIRRLAQIGAKRRGQILTTGLASPFVVLISARDRVRGDTLTSSRRGLVTHRAGERSAPAQSPAVARHLIFPRTFRGDC